MRLCLYELDKGFRQDKQAIHPKSNAPFEFKAVEDEQATTLKFDAPPKSKAVVFVKTVGWAVEHWLSNLVKSAINSFAFLTFVWTIVIWLQMS